MEGIYEPNASFPFHKLLLLTPTQTGGNYFIKFRVNDSPLYIQPPKCKSKGGIVKAGKKLYSDLMFTNENENFIQWMENLENHCQKIIYDNREKWFETELDNHDIENSFVSPLKLYKSGKYYIARTNIPCILGKCSLKIYDEYENEIDFVSIKENNDVMCILEVQGIKCSARSFQIEIEIKQMLLLKPANLFEKCIIKPSLANIQKNPPIDNIQFDDSSTLNEPAKQEEEEVNEVELNKTNKEEKQEKEEKKEEETEIPNKDENNLGEFTPTLKIEENDICEFELNLDEIQANEPIQLKNRNDVYYKMYKDAKRKAKDARDLALSSFLEAKRIKNTYMLNDIDSDSDLEEESVDFENTNEHI